jgi:hypothetical protein
MTRARAEELRIDPERRFLQGPEGWELGTTEWATGKDRRFAIGAILTPLLHKDAIESNVRSIKRRFPTFLGYFLKATLGLIQGMTLISRPSLSG